MNTNHMDLKLLRRIIRKGRIGGHIATPSIDCDYTIYGVSRKRGLYKFNIKVSNCKVKEYHYKRLNYWEWIPYKESNIPNDISRVTHFNFTIRNNVMKNWGSFLCGTFGMVHWDIEIGLIKHI